MQQKFLGVLLCALGWAAAAGGLDDIQPRLKSYESLRFPSSLKKAELRWAVQRAADEMYGKYYVDLGDMSDFMHGHVLFKPADPRAVPPAIERGEANPDLRALETLPILVLFHTKEFPSLRKGHGYEVPAGRLSNSEDRNWILSLRDQELGPRGSIVPAHPRSTFPDRLDVTVGLDDLREEEFGSRPGDWEVSVYFFRVPCAAADAAQAAERSARASAPFRASTDENNLIEVFQGEGRERVCLTLMDYHCRGHWRESVERCEVGVELPRHLPEWSRGS